MFNRMALQIFPLVLFIFGLFWFVGSDEQTFATVLIVFALLMYFFGKRAFKSEDHDDNHFTP